MLPNIKEIINKYWHILSINNTFQEIFNNLQPMIVFCKNTSLEQFIRANTIRNNKKFLKPTQTTTQVYVPHVTPVNRFAANKFSKQQHLQGLKSERPLQFFTKSLAIVTM